MGWHPLDGRAALPTLTIDDEALRHNVAAMADYCAERGLSLAPHGKTTMSPEIIDLQMRAGAWGITVATAWQASTLAGMGVTRILIASQLTDSGSIGEIARLIAHQGCEVICFVDSPEAVAALIEYLPDDMPRALDVLIEIGHLNGRTGARNDEVVHATARAFAGQDRIRLVGVAGYEGTLNKDGRPVLDLVDGFAHRLARTVIDLDRHNAFADTEEIIVSAGGSMYADRICAALSTLPTAGTTKPVGQMTKGVRIVLRSGVYALHDHGAYAQDSSFGLRGRAAGEPAMQAAVRIWSAVLSVPEPGLALLNFGKRDVGFDLGLPIPLDAYRDGIHLASLSHCTVAALSDQHAFLRWPVDADETPSAVPALSPGDVVSCGISHPCTTVDRWRIIPLIDPDLRVIGSITTQFG